MIHPQTKNRADTMVKRKIPMKFCIIDKYCAKNKFYIIYDFSLFFSSSSVSSWNFDHNFVFRKPFNSATNGIVSGKSLYIWHIFGSCLSSGTHIIIHVNNILQRGTKKLWRSKHKHKKLNCTHKNHQGIVQSTCYLQKVEHLPPECNSSGNVFVEVV